MECQLDYTASAAVGVDRAFHIGGKASAVKVLIIYTDWRCSNIAW